MMSDFRAEFASAKKNAENRLKGVDGICAFAGNHFTDPWPEWLARRIEIYGDFRCSCRTIFVLQDWGEELPPDLGVNLLNDSIEGGKSGEDDSTLEVIKQSIGRKVLLEGKVVIFNAVWARRASNIPKSRELNAAIHQAAFPIWAGIIRTLCLGQEKRSVCLCGSWAKWPEITWGEFRNGPEIIGLWKKWAPSNDVSPQDFQNIRFCTIPHPSAWMFNFGSFLVGLDVR